VCRREQERKAVGGPSALQGADQWGKPAGDPHRNTHRQAVCVLYVGVERLEVQRFDPVGADNVVEHLPVDGAEFVHRLTRIGNGVKHWLLHDIAIANTVWCMAYKRGVGGASYTAE